MPKNNVQTFEDSAIVTSIHLFKPTVETLFGPEPIIEIHTNKGDVRMRVDQRLQFHPSDYEGELLAHAISDIQARQAKLLAAA